MTERAYSALVVKGMDDEQRVITGLATSPVPDRENDVVDQYGARYAKEIPLFLYHDARLQVGIVKLGKPTAEGIPFEARLPKVVEPGTLKDLVDEAWQRLKYKLLAAVSIGFRAIADKVEYLKNGGTRYLACEILELSLVPIGMHQLATVHSIKSFDQSTRASLGLTRRGVVRLTDPPPGASGNTRNEPASSGLLFDRNPKGISMKTIAERRADFEAKKAENITKLTEIVNKTLETGETLDAEQKTQRQTLQDEIATIDEHLKMLSEHEALVTKSMAVVTQDNTDTVAKGASVDLGQGNGVISVSPNQPKGTGLTRIALAIGHSKGNLMQAASIAKRWKDTPQVSQVLQAMAEHGSTEFTKTAVLAGDSNTSGWASQLVYYNNMANEFIELLRPKTIIGRVPGLRKVPFNIRFGSTTTGSTSNWVGETNPIPASAMAFTSGTLGHAKAASLVVITKELAAFSNPAAEALVRDDMMGSMQAFVDAQFIDPSVAAVANVSPAAVTNGLSPITSTGSTVATIYADVQSLLGLFATAELDISDGVWVMKPATALALMMKRTSQDIQIFPGISQAGGTWFGMPVVTSNSVPGTVSGGSIIVLLKPSEIFFADDGGVTMDVSEEASVQMLTNPITGAASLVSLYQNHLVGLRAVREINWQRRRTASVNYIDGVAY